MIPQECKPALRRFGISRRSSHPARYGSLRHIESEHQKFSVNARSSPGWILGDHSKYQVSHLVRDSLSSDHSARSGDRAPVQGEPRPVPSHDGIWAYDDESCFPTRPKSQRENPEELIEHREPWLWMFAFQDCELLPQNKVFEQKASTSAKQTEKRSENDSKETEHGSLVPRVACAKQPRILLKTEADRILARHRIDRARHLQLVEQLKTTTDEYRRLISELAAST